MTRRERKERRLDRRLEWAAGRDRKAEAAFAGVHRIADNIPLGQPILVGHHSERHARKDQERIQNGMRRGCESMDMAKHHRSKADGIQHQLDRSIFTDDLDAVEKLETRIAELESQRERMKSVNAEIKRGAGWEKRLADKGSPLTDREKRQLLDVATYQPFYGCRFPPYALTNLGGNIRRLRERLPAVRKLAEDRARVREALAAEVAK